jgi:hypothetical protein
MTFAGDDAMSIPIIAANNATSAWGFACWLKATSLTAPTDNICAFEPPDSSGYKVICTRVNQAITFSAAKSDGSLNVRRGATGNVIANTTGWNFLTFEWDATGAGETQRFTITVNGGAPQTLSFINQAGTPGTITTLHAPTGVLALGAALSDASLQPMSGTLGPNLFFMNTKMAAATVGILTPAARLALMNFETPT